MKKVLGRLLIALWFAGMIGLAVRSLPLQGQEGGFALLNIPLLFRHAPALNVPPLESYLGLFTSDMGQVPREQELYIVRGDGSELYQLTDNDVLDNFPEWSPDGQRIVYIEDGARVMIVNVDGSNQRVIYEFGDAALTSLDWLPNSRDILLFLFVPTNTGESHHQILKLNVDTGESTLVLNDMRGAFLSPDGRRVAYSLPMMAVVFGQ